MSNRDPSSATPAQTLPYAAYLPIETRTSRLAIASLVMAALCCPCLLGPLSKWVSWYLPNQLRQNVDPVVDFWLFRGAMILATALPAAAVLRIRLSRRTRTGSGYALSALAIALLWWGLIYMLKSMWNGPFAS